MFFFPYRVDLPLGRIPFATILIAILCIIVFAKQLSSADEIQDVIYKYCVQNQHNHDLRLTFSKLKSRDLDSCETLFHYIHKSKDPQKTIEQLGRVARPIQGLSRYYSQHFITSTLQDNYKLISDKLPVDLTERLAYHADSYNIINMFTSQFAHADIFHLVGNLLFFYAFAASLEIVLGSLRFITLAAVMSIGVSLAFSLSTLSPGPEASTIGLSGVVMGMIGLFSYLMPTANIRCLLVILLYFRTITIPAWLLAIWFFGWDFYELFLTDRQTNVNLVAHVSGAFFGYALAAIFFRHRKKDISKHLLKMKK